MVEKQDDNSPVTIDCEYDEFEKIISRMKEEGANFLTLSTIREADNQFKLIYYFEQEGRKIVIRVRGRDGSIPSLYSYYGMADFIEREINNLFGIKFVGHPNLERIPRKEDSSHTESSFETNNDIS